MNATHEFFTLRSGLVVLAKRTKYGVYPMTFANLTQAQHRAEQLRAEGYDAADIYRFGRPFSVGVSGKAVR